MEKEKIKNDKCIKCDYYMWVKLGKQTPEGFVCNVCRKEEEEK